MGCSSGNSVPEKNKKPKNPVLVVVGPSGVN